MPETAKTGLGNLHRRYIVAIIVVAMLALCGQVIEKIATFNSDAHSELIHLASKQRMLSQRVAMLVFISQTRQTETEYTTAMDLLKADRDEFLFIHELLIAHRPGAQYDSGNWSEEVQQAYFAPPLDVDNKVRSYVASLDRHLAIPFEERSVEKLRIVDNKGPWDPMPDVMHAALEGVVRGLETSFSNKLASLRYLSTIIFAINLSALLIMGLVVFRPLVNRFIAEQRSLNEANIQLQEEMKIHKQLDQERATAEAKFRDAFENAPIGMGLMNPDGMLFDSNNALKRMFREQEEGEDFDFARVLLDEDSRQFAQLIKDVLDGQTPEPVRLNCIGADNDDLIAVVSIAPVLDSSKQIEYLLLQVQDDTKSHSLTSQLEYQASYDELTGLLNRRSFNKELEDAWNSSSAKGSFLLFMDLDQFKIINDTSGHAAGDQLLRRVSEVIRECVRTNDLVCRLGGDEFGVILLQCPQQIARKISEEIRATIDSLRFSWGAEVYKVGVSIGGVAIDPEIGDVNEIQQLADSACYAAKEAGRNCVQFVSEEKSSARATRGQIRWVQRIRDAMDKNRFAIYGQKIVATDPDNEGPDRVEVLLRLRDKDERRLIPPGAFLPAAERYGMNVELDEWVVARLLDMLFIHHAFQAENVRYWVNLSGGSIGDERFADVLRDMVRRTPLPPGTINFEITETAVIRNVVSAGNLISELQDMGCEVALDDFGGGLSSFAYLKRLPVDYLKIDGMFIKDIERDPSNRIFVKSIIDIAHSLGIRTVAECIENDAVRDLVTELGIDYVQGFGVEEPFVLAPQFPDSANSAHSNVVRIAG